MAEEKKAKSEEVQFPLNLRLLEESAKIKEERGVIRERLAKIEESKTQVSETVYHKVKTDYLEQLNNNTNQLLEKKQDIDRELSTLYEAKKKVESNVASRRETIEEIQFRQSLGEYNKGDYHKIADEENEKLGKFEKILSAIKSNIKKYESLFEGEEGLGDEPPAPEAPPPLPPSVRTKEIPPSAEEEYDIGKGDGYFGTVTEDVPLSEGTAETTNKEIEAPPAASIAAAKLTIIEGDGKGSEYVLIEEEMTLGRASSNFIVLKEAKVSRQHASLKRQGTDFLISDLHSSNGVFVNDEKIKEHALSNGDIIKIGDFVMKFSC